MEKIKEFIMNHRVVTIITGVVVVCLVAGGVAFGVHQSNVAKEKATIEAQKKEEAEKKAAEKKKAEEEAKKAEEEAEEAEVEEEVEVVAEATEETTTNTNTTTSKAKTSNTQSSSAQSQSAQSQSAPAQAPSNTQAPAPVEDEPVSREGMVQDAYGNWMPSTSWYVVKEGVGGTLLYSDGYKVVPPEAYDIFHDQIKAWRMEYYYQNGTFPSHEEEVEYVYNLSMQ